MQKIRTASVFAALVLGATLAGCQSAATLSSRSAYEGVAYPNLVMPDANLMELAQDDEGQDPRIDQEPWAYARNDAKLGSPPGAGIASIEFLEVRQREFLRTINGRPREFSTTQISSIKRGVTR